MKKLALLAGLTGILAVGAFAQQSHLNDSSTVTLTIAEYMAVFQDGASTLNFTLQSYDDNGNGQFFSNNDDASGGLTTTPSRTQNFKSRANRIYQLSGDFGAIPSKGTWSHELNANAAVAPGTASVLHSIPAGNWNSFTATLNLSGITIGSGSTGAGGTYTVTISGDS